MKIYQVFHQYDVDGGFGDAVNTDDLIAVFQSKENAEAFAEKFSGEHVYDSPYDDLNCGKLWVNECDVVSEKDFDLNAYDPGDFWWRPEYEEKRIKNCLVYDFSDFSKIPVDENGCITQDFCARLDCYDAGTPRDKIIANFRKWCVEYGYQMSDIEALAAQRGL